MNKFKLFLVLMFLAGFVSAQVRIVPVSLKQSEEMQIFSKEGEDTIIFFPSAYLNHKPKINVTLPDNYENSENRFCSVYILNKEELSKAGISSAFGKKYAGKCVYINIRFNSLPSSEALEGFLSRELLPYISVNYKVEDDSAFKTLMAGEGVSSSAISVMPALNAYFKNFSFLFYASTSMPGELKGLGNNISIWAAGTKGNMLRLQDLLEKSGLKFFNNFAYRIIKSENSKSVKFEKYTNLAYLLNKEECTPVKVTAVFAPKSASATSEAEINFQVNLKNKNSCEIDYIPSYVKIAPPFLSWDSSKSALKVIYGAEPGKVKISGMVGEILPFSGTFKITK